MSGAAFDPDQLSEAFTKLPIGILVHDAQDRVVFVNEHYAAILRVPPEAVSIGSTRQDVVHGLAARGIYGSGDPAILADIVLINEPRQVRRVRRRRDDGAAYEVHYTPLTAGGYMISLIDTATLVTMRDAAEASAARMQTAISALRGGLAVFGPDRRIAMRNLRFVQLLGVPASSVAVGMSLEEMVAALQVRDEFSSYDGDAFLASQLIVDRTRPNTVRRVRPNGQVVDITSDPLPDDGWVIAITDITPLTRAEEEARRRAGLLDSILRHVPHGICVYGPDRRVSMFNRAYHDIMRGAPLSVGEHSDEIIRRRAEAGEYGHGDIKTLIDRQRSFNLSRPQARSRRRPNGMTIDIRTAPLPDGGYISVVTDLTQLATAEDEVRRRVDHLDAMLGSIRHGLILWDRDRRIVASNHIAAALLEQPQSALVPGLPVAEIGPGSASGARRAALSLAPFERFTTGAGRLIDVHTDHVAGDGFVSTFTDVSDTEAAAERLRAATALADAANTAKSRFLAALSEELRQPLNTIVGLADGLGRSLRGPALRLERQLVDNTAEMAESARRLLRLLDTIMDVARVEAGRFDLSSSHVDLARLVQSCMREAGPAAAAAEVSLQADLADDLPLVLGDDRRLHQALSQVLGFFIRMTLSASTILIDAGRQQDGGLFLCVEAEGADIARDDLATIFTPFGPAADPDLPSPEAVSGEAGLGLYLSRVLLRAHGGDLRLEVREGEGTTALLCLPAFRLVPRPTRLSEDLE